MYDFVIVGGGSAGCALANRLSADPSTHVLVLEAGRADWRFDVFIHMPAALPFPIGSRFYDWRYESEPERHMDGRRVYHARGKVLGGSSSINGMIFQRGNPLDFEKWAREPGLESWDFAHCLPYFKRMETCLAGADDWRGGDGPLVLERGPARGPLFDAFFAAAQQAGYALTDDVNGYRQEGFAAFHRNIHRGRRLSAARAYLHPVMDRPNLEVRCGWLVSRVVFEGTRAVGVEVVGRGAREVVRAGEVILCGCAINSPQLLQLSGVGDPALLGGLGIDVVAALPGVGADLQDRLEWIEALRCARHILTQPAFDELSGGELSPGPSVETDEQIMDWVARDAETALHPSCTCRMGVDAGAVVDPSSMRVHGLDGLRVVDASVMPYVTNGNIYAPTMMIAEKSADLILGVEPLPPSPARFYRHARAGIEE